MKENQKMFNGMTLGLIIMVSFFEIVCTLGLVVVIDFFINRKMKS